MGEETLDLRVHVRGTIKDQTKVPIRAQFLLGILWHKLAKHTSSLRLQCFTRAVIRCWKPSYSAVLILRACSKGTGASLVGSYRSQLKNMREDRTEQIILTLPGPSRPSNRSEFRRCTKR